jgi:hypothetical protein
MKLAIAIGVHPRQFDELVGILGDVLTEAWEEFTRRRAVATTATASAPEAPVAPAD